MLHQEILHAHVVTERIVPYSGLLTKGNYCSLDITDTHVFCQRVCNAWEIWTPVIARLKIKRTSVEELILT